MKIRIMLIVVLLTSLSVSAGTYRPRSTAPLVPVVQIVPECEWGAFCGALSRCAGGGAEGVGCWTAGDGKCEQCFRGFLANGGGWVGVRVDKATGVAIVTDTGNLPDIKKGDQLRAIGAAGAKRLTNMRTGKLLIRYSRTHPARSLRLRLYRPSTGTFLTVTWQEKK